MAEFEREYPYRFFPGHSRFSLGVQRARSRPVSMYLMGLWSRAIFSLFIGWGGCGKLGASRECLWNA
jgi:hypothetical protein